MHVTISHHARERLMERLGCHEDKVIKVVTKAWRSKESTALLAKRVYMRPEPGHVMRSFMGCLFIFDAKYGAHCITIINPKMSRLNAYPSDPALL